MEPAHNAPDTLRAPTCASDAQNLIEALRLLGHPLRFGLLTHMVQGPLAVGDLAARTGQSLSIISQQLALLRRAGLVEGRREVKQVFYSLARARMADVAQALARMAEASAAGEGPEDASEVTAPEEVASCPG